MSIATSRVRSSSLLPYFLVFVSHYELLDKSLVRLSLVPTPAFRGLDSATLQENVNMVFVLLS